MCIQFQKKNFKNFAGVFAIHKKENNIHVHFLLNPVDINNPYRKFHKISPFDYQNIKENWESYLKIFGLYDGCSNSQLKQRSWGKYFYERKIGYATGRQNFKNYNMQIKEKFVDEFLNPSIIFFNRHSRSNLGLLTKKKYRKQSQYSYYNSRDINDKIAEIKNKWQDIRWALLANRLMDNTVLQAVSDIFNFSASGKSKISESYSDVYNKVQQLNLKYLFAEAKQLNAEFNYINDCVNLDTNKVRNYDDDFSLSVLR